MSEPKFHLPAIGISGLRTPNDVADTLSADSTLSGYQLPLRLVCEVTWRVLAGKPMHQDHLRCPDVRALAAMTDARGIGRHMDRTPVAIHYEPSRSSVTLSTDVAKLLEKVPDARILHLQCPSPSVSALRRIQAAHPSVALSLHVRIRTVLDQEPDVLVRALEPYCVDGLAPVLDEVLLDAAPVSGPGFTGVDDLNRDIDIPMVTALVEAVRAAYPALGVGVVGRIPSSRVPELVPLLRRYPNLRVIADLSARERVNEPFPWKEARAFAKAMRLAQAEAAQR